MQLKEICNTGNLIYYTERKNNAYLMSKSMPYCIAWLDQAHQREDIQQLEHRG
jgi:hypothetical protein